MKVTEVPNIVGTTRRRPRHAGDRVVGMQELRCADGPLLESQTDITGHSRMGLDIFDLHAFVKAAISIVVSNLPCEKGCDIGREAACNIGCK
jgi:hypothetical protein